MIYKEEFEIFQSEGWYVALACNLGGGTQGSTYEETLDMCVDFVRVNIEHALADGSDLPKSILGNKPQNGGKIVVVAVETSLEVIPSMSNADAARRLGVSTARVAQLCNTKQLLSWKVGNQRRISIESVEARLKSGPQPGRPAEK